MGRLTQAHIKAALSKPGRHHDGNGLFLSVRDSGQASWIARVQQNGKRRDIGLGSLRAVSLAEARGKAQMVKAAMVAGHDPILAINAPTELTRTFREAAMAFLEMRADNAKLADASQRQQLAHLRTYAFPALGRLQVQSIDADRIANCLKPIWLGKPVTAKKVRTLIIRILRFARPDGALFAGTLAPAVSDRLPKQPERGNFQAMPYRDVPAFWPRLGEKGGMGALALRLVILTAVRSGEVRGATWDEVDLEAAEWRIPAARMKARKGHRVPLSPAAVALLKDMAPFKDKDSDLIFPSRGGKSLSDMTLTKAMRDMGVASTVHGFRSAFRDWAADETDFPREVPEAALAHAVPNEVEAAYRRTDFFDKRRALMDAWASFVIGDKGSKIVRLGRGLGRK